jgi:hypothetical protein
MNTNPENLRLTTGRLYWKPAGETGYIDFGNCTSHKPMPDVQRVDHWKYSGGTKRVDMSSVTSLKPKRIFTFDEHFAATLQLQGFGSAATTVGQAPSVGVNYDIADATNQIGRAYYVGRIGVSNFVGTVNAGLQALVEGTHYSIDLGSGMVTVLSVAGLASDTFNFVFACAGVNVLNFTMFSKLLEQGTFKFLESDQFDAVPAGTENISGTVFVTGWGDGSSDKYQEFTVEVVSIE